jgi:hypothetical protein
MGNKNILEARCSIELMEYKKLLIESFLIDELMKRFYFALTAIYNFCKCKLIIMLLLKKTEKFYQKA